MRIILDQTLLRVRPMWAFTDVDIQRFGDNLGYKLKGTFLGIDLNEDVEDLHLGFVGLIAQAYNRHEKLRIAPHDLWFIFLTELAKIVNENSAACKSLFTTSDEKIEILVPTDDPTAIDPLAIMAHLERLVPTAFDAFLPELSTATMDVRLAMAATFADMVQSYYSYSTFMCGIPEIEVTGTFEDWKAMVDACGKLGVLFTSVNLPAVVQYIIRVGDIFTTIGAHVGGIEPPEDFWKGIFTSKNVGSGSELEISGWITKLFYEKRLNKLENFLSTYGVIPYKNLETGRHFKAPHGAFAQHRDEKGFIYAGYTRIVYEVPAE